MREPERAVNHEDHERIWESGYREAEFCVRSLRAIKSGYVFLL